MIILPAIDIIGGKPVRLYQGDYSRKEEVAADVVETACSFARQGAQWIHMVDLDGAKAGHPVNHELIARAASQAGIPVEAGGGIRTMQDIEWYLTHGISRVILGTSALQNKDLLKKALERYHDQIAVGIDARDGQVMVEGWLDGSGMNYLDFAREMEDMGVSNIIFTDISRDGTLSGPALELLSVLQNELHMDITASGGIHTIEDITQLRDLGLYGAITGKAVYAGTLDLQEAIERGKTC